MSPSHRNSLHLHRHPTSPDFLPRASGEAADVALCSRRPRQRRWAQTRPRVGGVRPWRSSGDDPGKGAESRAPWASCEAANGAGSPPPSPAFATISFCYATRTLSVPATPKPPHPGRTPDPSFRRGQKKPRRWSKAGESQTPREIAKPRKLVEPCSGRNGRTERLVSMLRGQRRRCPIKANGSGVKASIVRPHAGTGGCKRCAELLVCCKGAVRTTGDTATRGSEGRVESRRRGRCRVCPCVWGDGDTNELARFSRNGEVSVPTAAVGHCSTPPPSPEVGPSHRPDSTAHRPRPACAPES